MYLISEYKKLYKNAKKANASFNNKLLLWSWFGEHERGNGEYYKTHIEREIYRPIYKLHLDEDGEYEVEIIDFEFVWH